MIYFKNHFDVWLGAGTSGLWAARGRLCRKKEHLLLHGCCRDYFATRARGRSSMDRPPIDPDLMIRMLVTGYCMDIRSEQKLCEEAIR